MDKVFRSVKPATVVGGLVASYLIYKAFSSRNIDDEETYTMYKPIPRPQPVPNPPPKFPPESLLFLLLLLSVISTALAISLAKDISKQKTQTGNF